MWLRFFSCAHAASYGCGFCSWFSRFLLNLCKGRGSDRKLRLTSMSNRRGGWGGKMDLKNTAKPHTTEPKCSISKALICFSGVNENQLITTQNIKKVDIFCRLEKLELIGDAYYDSNAIWFYIFCPNFSRKKLEKWFSGAHSYINCPVALKVCRSVFLFDHCAFWTSVYFFDCATSTVFGVTLTYLADGRKKNRLSLQECQMLASSCARQSGSLGEK